MRRPGPPLPLGRRFGRGICDLDALAFDVSRTPAPDIADDRGSHRTGHRPGATVLAQLYGDVRTAAVGCAGMGPVTASDDPRLRSADGAVFASGKAAASYVGSNPSSWSSGTVSQPQPGDHQAKGPRCSGWRSSKPANAARRQDPQLAGFYHRLMTSARHRHTQACVAVSPQDWSTLGPEPKTGTTLPTSPDADHRARLEASKSDETVVSQQMPYQSVVGRAHSAATNRAKLTR